MQLQESWMSCRLSGPSSRPVLPQFAEFPLESRPPTLPPRNSPSRLAAMCVVAALCMVGMCSILTSAVGPAISHGSQLARGVRSVLDSAISHANEQARAHAAEHYSAREQLMQHRRLQDGARRPAKSSLLFRMAALRRTQPHTLDDGTVTQLFPAWLEEGGEWRHEAVLKDLVRAVADLAAHVTLESEQKTEF